MQYSVDVVIPTFKPDERLFKIIEMLENQTHPVRKIIIMNTEEKYYEQLIFGNVFMERYKNIEVHHVSEREFDHGRTRAKAVQYSKSDMFVCMTQDAIPSDNMLIEKLSDAVMLNEGVAVAYARQLPLDDCREIEKFTRSFNYPEQSRIKSGDDVNELGIKTFFCSNVCAAYNREIYEELGGFVKKAIFNEDMIFAGYAVHAGYKIAYESGAQVYHSHNYTCMQQFRRNFDLGVSQAEHPEIFSSVSSENEGVKLIKMTVKYLAGIKRKRLIPYLIVSSGFKYLGYQLGKRYESLPEKMILWCSSNKNYWEL